MKRFYKSAAAAPSGGGWAVELDGRPVKTPLGELLAVPAEALAGAIVGEWDAQGEKIEPASMPMMKLAATAIDRVMTQRAQVVADIARFGESDLLCYRADHPEALVARQTETWQPLLDWAASDLDARLQVTAGVSPISQDSAALGAVRAAVDGHDDFELVALHTLTVSAGSVVIGLAAAKGHIDAAAAANAALLDELYQAELWGIDKEAEARRRAISGEIENAARFLDLLRQS